MIMMMIGSRMIIITIITLIIVILFRELDLDLSAKEKTIVQRLDGTLGVTLVDFDEGLRVKCFWKRVESNRIRNEPMALLLMIWPSSTEPKRSNFLSRISE